jgi:hypothetical protein
VTDQEIALAAQNKILDLSDNGAWTPEDELQIIAEAVAQGRREGELDGITRGSRHTGDAIAQLHNTMLYQPLPSPEERED